MSLVMMGFRVKRTYGGKHPPEKITQGSTDAIAGKKLTRQERMLATVMAHEGYGVAAASVFAGLWQKFGPKRRWPVVHGMLFSLGFWFVSYKGWVPGVKLKPPPERDRPRRVIASVAAHMAYGAVLGANARKLQAVR